MDLYRKAFKGLRLTSIPHQLWNSLIDSNKKTFPLFNSRSSPIDTTPGIVWLENRTGSDLFPETPVKITATATDSNNSPYIIYGDVGGETYDYFQSGDPGAVGAGKYWAAPTFVTPPAQGTTWTYLLRRRNDDNTEWTTVGLRVYNYVGPPSVLPSGPNLGNIHDQAIWLDTSSNYTIKLWDKLNKVWLLPGDKGVAILLDAIPNLSIGRAIVAGWVPSQINVLNTKHVCLKLAKAGTVLNTCVDDSGMRIIWKEGGTDVTTSSGGNVTNSSGSQVTAGTGQMQAIITLVDQGWTGIIDTDQPMLEPVQGGGNYAAAKNLKCFELNIVNGYTLNFKVAVLTVTGFSIIDSGSGYAINQFVTIKDIVQGVGLPITFQVTGVNGSGGITGLTLISGIFPITAHPLPYVTNWGIVVGGSPTNALIQLTYTDAYPP